MGTIYWRGRSTDGIWKSKTEAASFLELFKEPDLEKEIINSYEYSVYDHAVLESMEKLRMMWNFRMKMETWIMTSYKHS